MTQVYPKISILVVPIYTIISMLFGKKYFDTYSDTSEHQKMRVSFDNWSNDPSVSKNIHFGGSSLHYNTRCFLEKKYFDTLSEKCEFFEVHNIQLTDNLVPFIQN